MSTPLRQFVLRLAQSGLMTEEEILAFQGKLPPELDASDPTALARELVRQGKVTSFQATAVYQGKNKGLVFGEYVVLDKLGVGGMGRVFKAVHRRMERIVALKVLPRRVVASAHSRQRFHREVKAAAKLLHPHIVTAYDAGHHEGIDYLVMEYIDGYDLGRLVREKGRLPVQQAVDYMLQAAKGLRYAHSKGIVHRDIKPSNLLVSSEGIVKILDMGLARFDDPRSADPKNTLVDGLTRFGQIIGTADYMAPEQAEDTDRADQRSDVYSLGCTLFRVLTRRPPYRGETLVKKIIAHRDKPIPDLLKYRSEATPEVARIVAKMMAKRPEDRHQDMGEVIEDLESVASTLEIQAHLGLSTPTAPSEGNELEAFLQSLKGHDEEEPQEASSGESALPEIRALPPSSPRHARRPPRRFSWTPLAALLMVTCGVVAAGWWWQAARQAVLHLEWPPAERDGASLEVDFEPQPIPPQGPLRIPLPPGRHHVAIRRRGYEPVVWSSFDLRRGQTRTLTPDWKPARIDDFPEETSSD